MIIYLLYSFIRLTIKLFLTSILMKTKKKSYIYLSETFCKKVRTFILCEVTVYEIDRGLRPKITLLAPLDSWVCMLKEQRYAKYAPSLLTRSVA